MTPTDGLADLGRAARKSDHILFIPHPVESEGSLGFDLWLRDELMGSGRLSTISEPAHAAGRAIIEVDAAPTPAWLERLARRARRLESERCFARGQTALAGGRLDEAAKEFGLASELRPEWSAAWEASARSQLARGSAEAALESSLRALEADSTASAPWHTLARIFEATDRTQEAHAAEEQARMRAEAVDGEQEHHEQGRLPF